MTYRGRFAPSPTGRLHFGSLVAALGSWLRARAAGGTWIVRIEDVDRTREVPGSADDILVTLAAFGLVSDEPVVRQSDRGAFYDDALQRLVDTGLAFACRCTRGDLAPHGGLHRGDCVTAGDATRTPAWRMRMPTGTITFDDAVFGRLAQDPSLAAGDVVLRRADGCWAYQLAVVVDDAAQGITEVVRGADLLDSTPRQIVLQRALGLSAPAWMHLPLALDADGRKLSKHDLARPVDAGDPLPALREALAFLGQPATCRTTVTELLHDAAAAFRVGAIPSRLPADAALRKD